MACHDLLPHSTTVSSACIHFCAGWWHRNITVLKGMCQVMACLIPFSSEALGKNGQFFANYTVVVGQETASGFGISSVILLFMYCSAMLPIQPFMLAPSILPESDWWWGFKPLAMRGVESFRNISTKCFRQDLAAKLTLQDWSIWLQVPRNIYVV